MHVAALSGQAGIMRLLIDTIKNINFIRRLYISDTDEQTYQRIQFILDMYLNTPDKMVFSYHFVLDRIQSIESPNMFVVLAKRKSVAFGSQIWTLSSRCCSLG